MSLLTTAIRIAFAKATAHQTAAAKAMARLKAASDIVGVPALDDGGAIGRGIDNGDGAFTRDPNDHFEHLIDGETAADAFGYTIQNNHGRSNTA